MRRTLPLLIVVLSSLAATSPRAGGPADEAETARIALVRITSVESAPPGWLQTEETVFEALARIDPSAVSPSVAADMWAAPGFRMDRARTRVRAALFEALGALERDEAGKALRHLRDCADLFDIGALVAVTPRTVLRQYHRLGARAHLSRNDREAHKAVRDLVALNGMGRLTDAELPADAVERARKSLEEEQPAGVVASGVPRDGVVYLDGVRLGTGAVRSYDVLAGTHYLVVVAPGKTTFGERLVLRPGKIARRTVRLENAGDSLSKRGKALMRSSPPGTELERLQKLSAQLGVTELLLMVPVSDGVRLRHVVSASGTWGEAVMLTADATPDAVERAVRQALGKAPAVGSEEIVAMATEAPDGKTSVTSTLPSDGEPSSGIDARWLWVGAGAVAVIAVVVGIVLVGGSESEPGKAPVWLCPGGSACAP